MDWITCAKSYVTVVDMGSLAQAAAKLQTSSSALSKRLAWLENQLGVQLLKRTTRSLKVTDAGQLFYQRSKHILEDWNQLLAETTSTYGEISGVLRIGAPLAVGSRLIVHYLSEFLEEYPKIQVELHTLTPGQLPDLNLDIMVTRELVDFNSSSYIATRLYDFQLGFYASPMYLARYAPITEPEQLTQHNCLLFAESGHQQERVFEDGLRLRLSGNFSSRNPEALVSAAVSGMGLLLIGETTIRKELDQGLLIPVLPSLKTAKGNGLRYYPKLNYNHTKTQLFIEFIKSKARGATTA